MSVTGRDLLVKRLPLSGILLGLILFYWLAEAIMDVLVFHQTSWAQALFSPGANELWMRGIIVALLVTFFLLGARVQAQRDRERRIAAAALDQSQARLSGIVESAMDAIIAVNQKHEVVIFNRAAEVLFGWTAAEAMGRPLDLFVPVKYRDDHREHLRQFAHEGVSQKMMAGDHFCRGLRKDGSEFPIEASISHSDTPDGGQFTVILRDVTEQERAEQSAREASAQLMETHARMESVTAGTALIMATVDRDFHYTFFNQAYREEIRRLAGKEIALGTGMLDVFADMPDLCEVVRRKWLPALAGECTAETIEFGDPARHRRTYSVRHTPILDGSGAIVGAGEIAWDITEQVRTAEALHLSEEQVGFARQAAKDSAELNTEILQSISDAFISLDESMVVTSFNTSAEKVLGRRREEVVGHHLLEAFPEVRGSIFEERYNRALRTKEPLQFEVHFEVPPYSNWYEVRVYPRKSGISVFFQVITPRKEAEETLRGSVERLKHTERIAHLGSWELDLVQNRLSWSDEAYRIFGLRPGESPATYETFLARVHPDDREAVDAAYRGSLRENRDSYEIEHRMVMNEAGEIRVVHERCEHMRDPEGRIIRSVGMTHDITDRRRTEDALRESEDRYRALVDLSPVAVFVNREDRIDFVNRAAIRLFGAGCAEEILGKSPFDLFSPVWHTQIQGRIQTLLDGGSIQVAEEQIVRSDGTVRDVEVVAALIRDSKGKAIQAILLDITERKKAEEALRESEEKYRLLFQNLSEGFALYELLYDEDGHPADWRVLEVNDAYTRHTGLSRETVVGHRIGEMFPHIVPEYLPLFAQVVATQAPIEFDTFARAVGRHQHVVTFPAGPNRFANTIVDVTLLKEAQMQVESMARFPQENPHPVLRITNQGTLSYANGASAELLTHWGCSPGGALPPDVLAMVTASIAAGGPRELEVSCRNTIFSLIFTPQRDAEDINVYGRDITAKRAAQEAIKASLREKEILLKEIHHRVRNNLQVISTLLDLQASAVNDPKAFSAFRESRSRVQAIALVHERLYRSENLSRVDFKSYIGDLVHHLASAYGPPSGTVNLDLHLGDVEMDLDHAVPCGLIINELVANAFEHAFPGGRGGTIRVEFEKEPEGKVRLSVIDDGVGCPEKKEFGGPPTLGLQLVDLLAHQLRGKIDVERGLGTRVTLRF